MLRRLQALYGDADSVDAVGRQWAEMRARGDNAAVDAIKERYCRRMYNLSQFVKTFKEKITREFRKSAGHVGHLFEGRFYSGLLQNDLSVKELVSLYIDYNPYKAGMARDGGFYRWSSFGQANGAGAFCRECRRAYETLFGCPWEEAREIIRTAFREKLPERDEDRRKILDGENTAAMATLVKLRVTALTRGPFIGRDLSFAAEVAASLPRHFPHAGMKSLRYLANVVEWPAKPVPAA